MALRWPVATTRMMAKQVWSNCFKVVLAKGTRWREHVLKQPNVQNGDTEPLVAQMVRSLPAGDPGSIPGSGRPRKILGREDCLGKAMATRSSILVWRILQNSCLDRGVWWAIVHGVAKSQTGLRDWTELNWSHFFLTLCRSNLWKTSGKLQKQVNCPLI